MTRSGARQKVRQPREGGGRVGEELFIRRATDLKTSCVTWENILMSLGITSLYVYTMTSLYGYTMTSLYVYTKHWGSVDDSRLAPRSHKSTCTRRAQVERTHSESLNLRVTSSSAVEKCLYRRQECPCSDDLSWIWFPQSRGCRLAGLCFQNIGVELCDSFIG